MPGEEKQPKLSDMTVEQRLYLFDALLNYDDTVKHIISNYQDAEKYWTLSSMSHSQEVYSKLHFLNTYEKPLQILNGFIKSFAGDKKAQEHVKKALKDKGISELMKDYRGVFEPDNNKSFYLVDPAIEENGFAKGFREIMHKEHEKLPASNRETPELAQFNAFLYSHLDYGMGFGADFRGAHGSVRPFIDNFISSPNEDKLRALYILENKIKPEETLTEEMMEGYKPDVKKIVSNIKSSPLKFWKRIGSSYIDFQSIKNAMAKQSEDKVKAEKAPEKKSGLDFHYGKRHIAHGVYSFTAVTSFFGTLGAWAMTAVKAIKVAATKAMTGLGIALTGLMIGKSVVEKCIIKNNIKELDKLNEDLTNLKKNNTLTEKQKAALAKIEHNAKIVRNINTNKVKECNADLIANSVGTLAAVPLSIGAGIAVGVGFAAIAGARKYQIEANDAREVADLQNFKTPEDKNKALVTASSQITCRFLRMPPDMQKKYGKVINKTIKSEDKLMEAVRDEQVRESGEVDLHALKNRIIHDVGESTFLITHDLKKAEAEGHPLDEVDKEILNFSERLVKAAGGKKLDFSKVDFEQPISVEEKQQAIEHVTSQLSEMTLG